MRSIETVADAAIAGPTGSATGLFFAADGAVVYDWSVDRARDGILPLAPLIFPDAVIPLQFLTLEAAIPGKVQFSGKAYFFSGTAYQRVLWTSPPGKDAEGGLSLDAWHLPAPFSGGVDAGFNGLFSREGKGYFFRGPQYLRYDWAADRVDPSYPRPIGTLVGMPSDFAHGIDAAIDGGGAFERFGYLFRREDYLRFDWAPDGGEPHVDGVSRPIRGTWPGLVELLMASRARSQAMRWIAATISSLDAFRAFLSGAGAPSNRVTIELALQAHFRIPATMDPARLGPLLVQIASTYAQVVDVFTRAETTVRFSSAEDEIAHGFFEVDDAGNPVLVDGRRQPLRIGAFGSFGGQLSVTESFPDRGPMCRAAMLVHEAVHVVDDQSGTPATHISEWYVSTPALAASLGLTFQADRPAEFATRYDLQATADALHNSSSYAAFAAHVHDNADQRFGDGKPDL